MKCITMLRFPITVIANLHTVYHKCQANNSDHHILYMEYRTRIFARFPRAQINISYSQGNYTKKLSNFITLINIETIRGNTANT